MVNGFTWRQVSRAGGLLLCVAVAGGVLAGVTAPDTIWSATLGERAGSAPFDILRAETAGGGRAVDLAGLGPRLTAIAAAAVAVGLVALAVSALGGGIAVGAAAGLSMGFGARFWAGAVTGDPGVVATALWLGALCALLKWKQTERRGLLVLGSAALGLTMALFPAAVAALPVIVGYVIWQSGPAVAARLSAAAIVVVCATVGTLMGSRAGGLGDALSLTLMPDAIVSRTRDLGSLVESDLGALGTGFLAAGILAAWWRRPMLGTLLGGAPALIVLACVLGATPDWQGAVLFAVAPLWITIGLGMHWVTSQAPRTAQQLLTVGLVVMLPVMSFASHRWIGADANAASRLLESLLDEMATTQVSPVKVVAEGGLVDRLVARIQPAAPRGAWTLLELDPVRVERALADGFEVLGINEARRNLEALGFRFQPLPAGVPMTLRELLDSVPAGAIVAAATGPLFARTLPADAGPTFAPVGGTRQLFGSGRGGRGYAIVGVKDRPALVRETLGARAVVEVRAGENADATLRWPSDLRAISSPGGAVVEFAGEQVAASATGLALAVTSSAGELLGAYAVEADGALQVKVRPRGLSAGRIIGREPCRGVTSGTWADLSDLTGRAGLAALLDPGDRLTVYVAASDPLRPVPIALRVRAPAVQVESFDLDQADQASDARARLVADDVDPAQFPATRRYLYRLAVLAHDSGRSLLALRLGGTAPAAAGRLSATTPGRTISMCSPMRHVDPLFASPPPPGAVARLDLASDELFVRGWDRVETIGRQRLRWTRALSAQVLVPLRRAYPLVVELDAQSVGKDGTTVSVAVNGTVLAGTPVSADARTYRFAASEDLLRAGINVLTIRTSDLVRPSDLRDTSDDRMLGVAISALRLRLTQNR